MTSAERIQERIGGKMRGALFWLGVRMQANSVTEITYYYFADGSMIKREVTDDSDFDTVSAEWPKRR